VKILEYGFDCFMGLPTNTYQNRKEIQKLESKFFLLCIDLHLHVTLWWVFTNFWWKFN